MKPKPAFSRPAFESVTGNSSWCLFSSNELFSQNFTTEYKNEKERSEIQKQHKKWSVVQLSRRLRSNYALQDGREDDAVSTCTSRDNSQKT